MVLTDCCFHLTCSLTKDNGIVTAGALFLQQLWAFKALSITTEFGTIDCHLLY